MELFILGVGVLIALTFIDRLVALFRAAVDKVWIAILLSVLAAAVGYWAIH